MELKHVRTIAAQQTKKLYKIAAVCWSNNNRKLAVAENDGTVHLFDETGEHMEKFPTKAHLPQAAGSKPGAKSYVITGMVFSPDDMKIAIAQSDDIVFVYKIGFDFRDKKSICNKYLQPCPVTCICWPIMRTYEVVFGRADGRVRIGNTKSNKNGTLYTTDSPVVALASSPDGQGIISGHADGSIHRFYFKEIDGEVGVVGNQKIIQHPSVPQNLVWGDAIAVAGSDKKVAFYHSREAQLIQQFDYSNSKEDKDFSSIVMNPSGQCVVVGSFNRFRIFNFNIRRSTWEEGEIHDIPGMYSVTSMAWKPDGSRLVIGNMCGNVDMYDACLKRLRYKQEFEFTYVSPSQVIVKRLSSGTRIVLKSIFGYEILKVNVARDQYLVGHTTQTLLLGDLESCKLSEIHWTGSGNEKYFFDNPKVCLVYNAGEISIIEYGINDIIGSFRTEHLSSHLVSVRISYRSEAVVGDQRMEGMDGEGNKKVAFLIDSHTIRVLDLVASVLVAKVAHDSKIDFLELNAKGTKLLFRDKQRQLHLYDIKNQQKTTLLPYCSYAQWVPDSDVVVAQNRGDLCVWYSIDAPDRVTIVPIKGEVESIVRSQGTTAVIVDEGPETVNYDLDEGLIEFGSALEEKDYEKAADNLEQLSLTPETEAMWQKLSELTVRDQKFHIAERCFSALGDVAKARYLRKLVKECRTIEDSEEELDPFDHWKIRAKLFAMKKDFKTAEQIYLEQGKVEEAMQMYEQVHKFEESIAIAMAKGVSDASQKKDQYIEFLIKTKQEDKAAKIYENEGKYVNAINLYLQGGFPASAATVVTKNNLSVGVMNEKLLDSIATSLMTAGLFEKAGEFFEKRGQSDKAIEAYKKANSYRNAVELARNALPNQVVKLEEEWGDWLVAQKQMEGAIHHYIEAGQYIKGIEAAIAARQWVKAIQILEGLEPSVAQKYYIKIANYYAEVQNYKEAKKYYLKANEHREAMLMFESAGLWDEVQQIAESYLNEKEIQALYFTQASRLETKQKFKEAEKLYLKAKEPDLAINMYKKNHMFDDMIRLVTQFRNVHLQDAHVQIAQQLENEGHLTQSERHYILSGDWLNAVNMYRKNDKWNDAIRVAKQHGPPNAWKKVAIEWAITVGGETGGEAGAKLLAKLGLVEEAINYCLDRELWPLAFETARNSLKTKLPDVHLKYAMYLEDQSRFKEAEDEYVNAQSPKEAIEMYIHQQDWSNAMRVAEAYDPSLITYVLEHQADTLFNQGEFERSEKLFLQAKKPEKIIQKYREINRFQDAKRVAEMYLSPDIQRKITSDWAEYQMEAGEDDDPAAPARMFKKSGEYSKAIDAYLGFKWQNTELDPEYLHQEWLNAVEIAANHLQNRLPEVVKEVSRRLISLQRPKQAAELAAEFEQYQESIEILLQANMWDQALQLAKSKKPDLLPAVQQRHKQYLMSSKKPEELAKGGNINAALEAFQQRGDYESCLKLAQESGLSDSVRKYTGMYVTHLVRERQIIKALQVLELYGLPIEKQMAATYAEIVKMVIWKTPPPSNQDIQKCRDMLYSLINGFHRTGGLQSKGMEELNKYLEITHLMTMKAQVTGTELKEIYAKICVSLLRYSDCIPPDAAFYEAGEAAKAMKNRFWDGMAFIFLNRYLDISEAINDLPDKNNEIIKAMAELENTEFQDTDIPYHVPIPRTQYLSQERIGEVTDMVVGQAMDGNNATLMKCKCENCNKDMYSACLVCPSCNYNYQPCVITGYPVFKAEKVACSNCQKPANKTDWNSYFMKFKNCPWCSDMQFTKT